MKRLASLLSSRIVLTVFFLFAVVGTTVYRGIRAFWVFYDPNIPLIGARGLFAVCCAEICLLLVLLILRLRDIRFRGKLCHETLPFRILSAFACVLSLLIAVFACCILILNGYETNLVLALYLKKDLPLPLAFLLITLISLYVPVFPKTAKRVTAAVLTLCLLTGFFLFAFPPTGQTIRSAPVVLDTGEDYSVVFATTAPGTGFVTYTYEGETHTVYQQKNGRRVSDRVLHAIRVPYEHLANNDYSVGSTRVIESYGYGSRLGQTAQSEVFHLTRQTGSTQTFLTLSDWHSHREEALAAGAALGDFDAVLLLGDPASDMDFEEQAVRDIVEFAGMLTKGEKPAVYVRGNHETRGAFAASLADRLGLDRFYRVVQSGGYTFVALDSGEDKNDGHTEYGGLVEYANNRREQLNWLKKEEMPTDRVVALSHFWAVAEPAEELEAAKSFWTEFFRLGVSLIVSGHTHRCRLLGRAGDSPSDETERAFLEAYPDTAVYMDGGFRGEVYIGSRLTLSPDGIRIEAKTHTGETVLDERLPW